MAALRRKASWRPASRAAVAVVGPVVGSQLVALAEPGLRPPILFASVVLLDILGVVFGVRAARRSRHRWTWRLVTAARASAVVAFASLLWYVTSADPVGYWAGIGLRALEFTLLAAGTFVYRLDEIKGRGRWSFAAEITIVVSAGCMVAWYVALGPALHNGTGVADLARLISYVGGDLLMLASVGALLLGGILPRPGHPRTPMIVGLVLLLITDIWWNASVAGGANDQPGNWLLGAGMVGAGTLLTLAPIRAAARPDSEADASPRTAWSQALVPLALLVGAGMMIVVTVREHALFPWGGLVACLMIMVVAVMVHMTASLRSARDLVVVDPLTGLANRGGLALAIAAAARRQLPAALLLLDLDDFKLINDAYGHTAGDTVLTEVGHHLRAAVRKADTCARIGGDEFAILLLEPGDPELVAQRILAALAGQPVHLGDDTATVHASIGLTDVRAGDTDKDLMHRADLAMYTAKRLGTHSFMRHDPSMVDRRALDAALAGELAGAAGRGELVVVYQPIVEIATGTPHGYEALVRWEHPTRGLVPPLEFIPAAERTGLIHDIGLHVLRQACTDLRASPGRPYVSVNLSPRQLQAPTLVHDVLTELRRSGLEPARLVLEVTESAIADDAASIATLRELRGHGIGIAVDDFGTGYSSLQYLTRLPVDILKIDRSFVNELNGTPTGAAITEAVIRLAQALRLRTIAEGIETHEQAAELLALGCHTGQGYLYAPPRPAAQALAAPAVTT